MNPHVKNVRSVSVRHEGPNTKVGRLTEQFENMKKSCAGTAQQIVEAMRINYNLVREHQAVGKTPAEHAGIRLDLGQNRIERLIRLAAAKRVQP